MESFCRRGFGPRSRGSAKDGLVARPSPEPDEFGPNPPGPPVAPASATREGRPADYSGWVCQRQPNWVSRWRTSAASAGLGRATSPSFAAFLAVRLAIEETEPFPFEPERVYSRRIHSCSNQLVRQMGLSALTVNAALADLEKMGILEEIAGRKRGRVFSYRRYLAILSEGTDPLPVGS